MKQYFIVKHTYYFNTYYFNMLLWSNFLYLRKLWVIHLQDCAPFLSVMFQLMYIQPPTISWSGYTALQRYKNEIASITSFSNDFNKVYFYIFKGVVLDSNKATQR